MKQTYVAGSVSEIADYLRELADKAKASAQRGTKTEKARDEGLAEGYLRSADVIENTTIRAER